MNKSNFFQKNGFFIFLLIIFGLVFCYFWFQNQKETSLVSESESLSDLLPSEETSTSPRPKRSLEEQPIPKIKTTAARLEKIKKYLFTENANLSFLPTDLSEREQEEINKLKKSWGLCLDYLNEEKSVINEYQNKCDEYQSQLNSLQPQIEALKSQQQKLEKQRDEKKEILQKIEYQCGEISPSYAKTLKKMYNIEIKNPKIPNKIEEIRLQAEIDKLRDEISEIVGEIGKIKVQIGKLEATQRKYQDMLTRAEKFKGILQKQYKDDELQYKNNILNCLQSLYEITSAEE
ncbi:MAG: hypothetical protein Q8885_00295 [Candidatus Phytoplasma stylosanthis]|nr:hypothetical protein [Candidatus Phytoplasma stylosanthis]